MKNFESSKEIKLNLLIFYIVLKERRDEIDVKGCLLVDLLILVL